MGDIAYNPEQRAAIDRLYGWTNKTEPGMQISLSGAAGTGKCLGLGTLVMKFDGSCVAVEDVLAGDQLMGPDGQPRRVLSITQGLGPMYRVVPVRGEPWTCNDVHVLTLAGTNHHAGKIRDVPLNVLLEEVKGRRADRDWKLFKPDGIDFQDMPQPEVDPYFFGLWVGDGTKERNFLGLSGVSISTMDNEVVTACAEMASAWGLHVNVVDEDRCPRLSLSGQKGKANQLTEAMRRMLGERLEIPDCIRLGSRQVRASFLAGICDSDGHLTCGGFEIAQKRADYAQAIAFIARSIGLWVTMATKSVNGTDYSRLHISGHVDRIPAKIKRKIPEARRQIKDPLRTGFDLVSIGDGEYAGFELDGDGRFLLGDFTVTHNTTVLGEVKRPLEGKQVAWTAMTGKAALRMREAAGVEAKTLHSVLYKRPSQGRNNKLYFNTLKAPEGIKYLIIDEASMITPKIYNDIQAWVAQGVRVLYVGDGYQLPPVLDYKEIKEHGEDFSIFCKVEGPQLNRVMRSGDDIITVATQLREENQVPKKNVGEAYKIWRSPTPGMSAIDAWLKDNDDHILITWRNKLRMAANRLIRKRLGFEGVLPNKGEPVMLCKNGDTDSGPVLNGEIHFAEEVTGEVKFGPEVTCKNFYTDQGLNIFVNTQGREEAMDGMFPNVKEWALYMKEFRVSRMPDPIPITYGYVSTAHKAQGSEYGQVTVFLASEDLQNDKFRKDTILPNGQKMPFATRWLYTSITRAKSRVYLILGS